MFEIDGYNVGDRLLEGVLFFVYFNENGEILKIEVNPSQKHYFDSLNTKKWLRAVKNEAQDILEEGDEVEVPRFIKEKYYKNGINCAYITVE